MFKWEGKSNILFGCISKKGNPSSSHAYVTYAFVAVNRKKMISLPNRDRKNIIYNGFIRNTSTKARHKRWRIQSTPRLSPSYHHHLRLPLRPPRRPAVATRRRRARRTHLNSFPSLTPICCRLFTPATALCNPFYRNFQHNACFRL